jgi:hypothetical protein
VTIVRTNLPASFRSRRYARLLTHGAALSVALGLLGCSGDRDAMEKRVKELQEELTRVQNGNDRLEERVSSLELSRQVTAQAPPASTNAPDAPERLERPPLKIVKLVPGARASQSETASAADSTDTGAEGVEGGSAREQSEADSGPRPVIRGRGARIEKSSAGRPGAGKAWSKPRAAKKVPDSVESEPTGGAPPAESK